MILTHKDIEIFYTDEGSGKPIVLLHGFLEDHTMWNEIKKLLIKRYRVITMDLLGHGKTPCLSNVRAHTMEDMAEVVHVLLDHLKIGKPLLIGHSMGGYIALTYAKQFETEGLCLLNSTYKEDSLTRKKLRAKANMMIADNFESMVRVSFANLFSESSKKNYKQAYQKAQEIALNTSIESYISANEGMRIREDFTEFFKNARFKKAMILGEKDLIVNYKTSKKFCIQNNIPIYTCSEGHMSYIENPTECKNQILHFVEKK